MNRHIKAMLVEKGITQAQIANKLKLKRSTISVVLGGHGKSKRVQRAIARALGKRVVDLWPREDSPPGRRQEGQKKAA